MAWLFALASILFCSLSLCAEKKTDPNQELIYGLPNISERSGTFKISTDVLLWAATESGSENWAQIFTSTTSSQTIDILAVPFGWDVGFRVGLDYSIGRDDWDTEWIYTWYQTDGKNRASSPGQIHSAFIGNFYVGNADGASDSGPTYHNASIQWKILLNMFDWDLGRKYWVSSGLSLRPFLGLKGGWIHQSIHSKWENPIVGAFTSAKENITNNFWGIGPNFGLNTKWKWGSFHCHSFSLFADFSGALMWGHWTLKDVYRNNGEAEVDAVTPSINSGATTLRGFSGLAWETSHFSLRLGYEAQFWLDQLKFYSYNVGWQDNDLTLQGGSFDLNFAF